MRNSACARLMTPIIPKITARPRARRMSVAIVYRMPNAVTATKSIVLRAAGPGRLQSGDATPTLELRRVLLCLIRVLDQVANLHSVRGRDVRERLDNREAALLVHLGEVHRMHDVMALGVERDLALRRLERQAALERLGDRVPLERPRLLHRRGPEVPAVPDGAGRVGDVGVVRAEALVPAAHPLPVDGVLELLKV